MSALASVRPSVDFLKPKYDNFPYDRTHQAENEIHSERVFVFVIFKIFTISD